MANDVLVDELDLGNNGDALGAIEYTSTDGALPKGSRAPRQVTEQKRAPRPRDRSVRGTIVALETS
jgi:hypothetical protein